MPRRIVTTPVIQSLFTNSPIEFGLTDDEIVTSANPPVNAKSFARWRTALPKSITLNHLLMISRLAESQSLVDAADVIAMVRDPHRHHSHWFYAALAAKTFSCSTKEQLEIAKRVQLLATRAGRIHLFDRSNSFNYLQPPIDEDGEFPCLPAPAAVNIAASHWLKGPSILRYDRQPRVFVTITQGSMAERIAKHADAGLEHLLTGIEAGEHSLAVISDSLRFSHRIFRGVFADAQAITIFDRSAMVVYPKHQRAFRLYESKDGHTQSQLIAESLRLFRHMRKFLVHAPTIASLGTLLRSNLTYRIPSRGRFLPGF
jgi:hypothetical protein